VTSPARSVAVLVDEQAQPIDTTVRASSDILVKAGKSATVKVTVTADDGSAPVGTVTVHDRGKVVATVELTPADKGRATVSVPKLGRGIHLLTVRFDGTEPWQDSRGSRSLPVIVY
jgi:hypothetical protein